MTGPRGLNIAFITHYTEMYGANRSLLDLMEGLADRGIRPHVVAPADGEVMAALRARGIPAAVVPNEFWMHREPSRSGPARRLVRNLRQLPLLLRQLRTWGIDVVYSNSAIIPIGRLAAAAMGRPHVWHLREFGDLDYGLLHDWGQGVFRRVAGSSAAVIAISQAVRRHYGLGGPRVHVIYDGVMSPAHAERLHSLAPARSIHGRPYTFAIIGLLHPGKEQLTAIEALASVHRTHPGVRLLVLGGGSAEYQARCRQAAGELGVSESVQFLGYRPDPEPVYLESDAIITCARHEAMGRTTIEGMFSSLPVIGFDGGGTAELIEHERTGLLYSGGAAALAGCMLRLVEDPEFGRRLGANGWCTAREKYTTDACAGQIDRVLEGIVKS